MHNNSFMLGFVANFNLLASNLDKLNFMYILACLHKLTYVQDLFFMEQVTEVTLNFKPIEVHPQPSHNNHPMDVVLVGANSL